MANSSAECRRPFTSKRPCSIFCAAVFFTDCFVSRSGRSPGAPLDYMYPSGRYLPGKTEEKVAAFDDTPTVDTILAACCVQHCLLLNPFISDRLLKTRPKLRVPIRGALRTKKRES